MALLLRLLARLLGLLPRRAALALGRGLGLCLGALTPGRRREARAAMARALPGLTPERVRAHVWGMYRNLGMNVVETLLLSRWSRRELAALMDLNTGPAAFDRLLERGRGLLVIIAHTGNWEVLAASGVNASPLAIVVKDLKPRALNDFVVNTRGRFGTRVFPRRGSLRQVLRHLRGNGVIGFMMDQNAKRDDGVFVDFFGMPACTTRGLAQIAAATRAPALPVFPLRRPDGTHFIRCLDPIEPPADNSEAAITAYTQRAVKAVEAVVREHPDQWIWLHRRWKTRPPPPDTAPGAPA